MHQLQPTKTQRPKYNGHPVIASADPTPAGHVEDVRSALRPLAARLGSHRVWLLAMGHMALFVLAYWVAYLLRFDFSIPDHVMGVFWSTVPWIVAVKLMVFYFSGHFHGWWRYVTFSDLAALLRASVLSFMAIVLVSHFWFSANIYRSVLILDCIATIVLLGSLRCSWRMFREQFWPAIKNRNCRGALLVGADHSCGVLAHQIHSHGELGYRIRGFVDEDQTKQGSRLGGIPVLGTLDDVPRIAAATGATDVLVRAGSLPGGRLRQLMETCRQGDLELKIIPPVEDLFKGTRHIPVRDIEINDLLRREPVQLDCQAIQHLLEGRVVMVTGAGGSIGSELCRQVLRFHPAALVLVGKGEHSIFTTERELQALDTGTRLEACIADVTDEVRMRRLFEVHRPELVFHAAAHKHVPLMEANVGEAIKNNVFGTKCVADLADQFGCERFVLISTDKAVNPTSVMGVSKQIAERYIHTLSQESSTRFVVVRFGNVLGSTGSVVPIFQDQIRRGGPITITDPRMTRFFMTIPEASQLVLQGTAMGRGGEIYVLEMGRPVRIVDLAQDMIRLSGLPQDAIEITFTGVRPGEKLYEELYFQEERTLSTPHPKLRAAYHRPYSLAEVRQAIMELGELLDAADDVIRAKVKEIVPEYSGLHMELSQTAGGS